MRRRRRALLGLGLLLATACRSDAPDSAAPATKATSTTSSPVPTTAGPATTSIAGAASGRVTFRARDVQLSNSEESDNGLRVLIQSPDAEVVVVLRGIPSPNRVVFVCPATELERRVPAPGCLTPAAGEAVRVAHAPDRRGVEVVQVGTVGGGGNSSLLGEVAITYTPVSREVQLRLPPVPPGEGAPSFVLTPAGAGRYRASANWPDGGATTIALTMTVGTKVVAQIEGSSASKLDGDVSPPAEGVLRLRNPGSTTLSGLTVSALFP